MAIGNRSDRFIHGYCLVMVILILVSHYLTQNLESTQLFSTTNTTEFFVETELTKDIEVEHEFVVEQSDLMQENIELPISFDIKPSSDSLCGTSMSIVQDQYCKNHKHCFEHEQEDIEAETTAIPSPKEDDEEGCKMLWFAGFHEGTSLCNTKGKEYKYMYSVALNSAIANAAHSLQPVLMLGRLELKETYNKIATNITSTPPLLNKFGEWAKEKGAKVVIVPRLSFQDSIDKIYPNMKPELRQGPWLRLEIPHLVRQHALINSNICKRHVLYTDVDVLFANTLRKKNVQELVDALSADDAVIMYGRQFPKAPKITNTGVMLINIHKFGNEIPRMIENLEENGKTVALDQGLINRYFETNKHKLKRTLLPIHYNWKAYWKLEPSTIDQVKIIHTHGAKPGIGMEEIGSCNFTALPPIKSYDILFRQGICCDKGRTAAWFIKLHEKFLAPSKDICDS